MRLERKQHALSRTGDVPQTNADAATCTDHAHWLATHMMQTMDKMTMIRCIQQAVRMIHVWWSASLGLIRMGQSLADPGQCHLDFFQAMRKVHFTADMVQVDTSIDIHVITIQIYLKIWMYRYTTTSIFVTCRYKYKYYRYTYKYIDVYIQTN